LYSSEQANSSGGEFLRRGVPQGGEVKKDFPPRSLGRETSKGRCLWRMGNSWSEDQIIFESDAIKKGRIRGRHSQGFEPAKKDDLGRRKPGPAGKSPYAHRKASGEKNFVRKLLLGEEHFREGARYFAGCFQRGEVILPEEFLFVGEGSEESLCLGKR